MQLLTEALKRRFAKVGSQEGTDDPLVIAKFFFPVGRATWYATEYDPEEELFFGWVSLYRDHNDEFGEFSLEELEGFTGPMGLKIERDLYWTERPLSQALKLPSSSTS